MAVSRKSVPDDKIAEARQLYEHTPTPVADIAARLGLSPRTLGRRVTEWGWTKRINGAPAVAPREAPLREAAGAPPQPAETWRQLVERLFAVVDGGIGAVEQILQKRGVIDPGASDGIARLTAGLARTLRELAAHHAPPPADDTPVPRDLDELRRTLTQKLERIIAERRAAASGEP